jgi:hypothetical protein
VAAHEHPPQPKDANRTLAHKKTFITNEAGMCMKTNKTWTKCTKKVGHLSLTFGHLGQSDTDFAENRSFFVLVCAESRLL